METIEVQIDLDDLAKRVEQRVKQRAEAISPNWAAENAEKVLLSMRTLSHAA